MKKWGRFLALFSMGLGFLLAPPLGEGQPIPGEEAPPLTGPIHVLLYHPYEEGFESAFRNHLHWLKENGYETIPIETLIDSMAGKSVSLPQKPILLTFDDGTIENHTLVYPLLQEVGYSGVAFVITDRSFTKFSKKSWWQGADRAGTLRIESHSHSHGLVWVGPDIVDFYEGENSDLYLLIKGLDLNLGAVIYDFRYELISDRYFPDKRVTKLCEDYVAQNGGEGFFHKEGWREELWQVVEEFRRENHERGRYEGERQREMRLKKELFGSKRVIEQAIGQGKEVNYFAYPWGVYDEDLILMLKKYGYRGAFTTDYGENYPGEDPFKIKRITITSEMTVEDLAPILTSPAH